MVDRDEHPRATRRSRRSAGCGRPSAKDGTVTAGNSSGINDGAAALLLSSRPTALASWVCGPLARVVATAVAGVTRP